MLSRMSLALLTAALGLVGSAATAAERSSHTAPPRPNILWITCEDISPNLGCYGDRYAITPNLDRLAAAGVRYTNAFGITGVCAPNRSCLITGVYPCSLGSQDMRCTVTLPDAVKCFPEHLRKAGYYCTNNAKTDYNFAVPRAAWDECSRQGHWRNRPAGQPFFAVFNIEVSHESQIRVPEAQYRKNTARLTPPQRHDPAQAPVPPFHPDTPEVRRDWARYYDNITAMDYRAGDLLQELQADGLAEDTIVFFFGDNGAGMPGVKKWVWEGGLHVPLLIRFPEKYRQWAPAAPGAACDRLVSFVDFGPTVLSLAGVTIPAAMQGTAFLGPSAGLPRQYVHGMRDRMAERFDTVRVVRDARFQYVRNFQPHLSWSQFVSYTEEMPTMKVWRQLAEQGRLTGPAARYFAGTKPVEELYDTADDPHQIRNLATDPSYGRTLDRLRTECFRWMRAVRDVGLLPEQERLARAGGRTLWELARDPQKNPLPQLLGAAATANRLDSTDVPALLALLSAEDAAVRWWGATGLAGLGAGAAVAADRLETAVQDKSPEVRIAAAEALSRLGRQHAALPVLVATLKHPSPVVRLRALNALDRLGEAARAALPDIRAAAVAEKGHIADYVNRMVEYLPRKVTLGTTR